MGSKPVTAVNKNEGAAAILSRELFLRKRKGFLTFTCTCKLTPKIWAKWRFILSCNKCDTGYPFLFQVQKPYPLRSSCKISFFWQMYSTVGERVPICRLNTLLKIKAVSFLLYRKQGTKLEKHLLTRERFLRPGKPWPRV